MIAADLPADMLVRLEELVKEGVLNDGEIRQKESEPDNRVSFYLPVQMYFRICDLSLKHEFEDGLGRLIKALDKKEQS